MKNIALIIFLFAGSTCLGQDVEFGKSTNGLIYSDKTINKLKFIVDSLNLKFRICDINKIYLSKFQAKANFISLESGKIKEAKKDIEANISFDAFISKYNKAKVERKLLVIKATYKNYEDEDVVEFSSIQLGKKYDHDFNFKTKPATYDRPLKGKWVYEYYDKTDYSKPYIEAFYFVEEFLQVPLPKSYAAMVQYSDCMVDTSTQIFYEKARRGGVRYYREEPSKLKNFMAYIHKETGMPEYDESDYENYRKKYKLWDSLRFLRIDSVRKNDPKFDRLLQDAITEAIDSGGTGDEFEEYVGLYYSKKAELEFKRSRIVVGGCSQDMSPRIHALNIAKLSAETAKWEIFLRSHLDIMNDRFERVSDGSYAWGRRKTYIKELEVLDINVPDLLLGICLRIENPNSNHYFGDIGRIGRALSETNKSVEIEAKMLQMISSPRLDDYNRLLIYYLFVNYNYYLENKERQTENEKNLMAAVKTLPEYLASKIIADK